MSLSARAVLLGFSLCLRPAAHRELQDTWQPGALPIGRQDPEPQGTRCTGALPAGLEPWYMWRHRNPSYKGGKIWSRWTRGAPEPSQWVWSHGTRGGTGALLIMEAGRSHWTRGSFRAHLD
jgi:hypothetical protein